MNSVTKIIIAINNLNKDTKRNICIKIDNCPVNINCTTCPLTILFEKEELDEWYSKSNN